MNFQRPFRNLVKIIGNIGSDRNCDVYQVDYTAFDLSGSSISINQSIRYDLGNKFAEPPVPGGQFYDLFMNFDTAMLGNVIYPTGSNPTSSIYPGGPVITICQEALLKSCVGLLTDIVGSITEDDTTVRYNNVRWQWARQGQPKSGRNKIIEDSFPSDKRTAIMYRGVGSGQYQIFTGMHMIEFGAHQRAWKIVDYNAVGPYLVLLVEEADD